MTDPHVQYFFYPFIFMWFGRKGYSLLFRLLIRSLRLRGNGGDRWPWRRKKQLREDLRCSPLFVFSCYRPRKGGSICIMRWGTWRWIMAARVGDGSLRAAAKKTPSGTPACVLTLHSAAHPWPGLTLRSSSRKAETLCCCVVCTYVGHN